jgi:threonylcarbamoyladenosine tRNA methylthiotransferase MtaB
MFETFGCRLNRAETLDSMARYKAAGWEITDNTPDLIIVRGCSVTAKAQRDCEKRIARLHELHPGARLKIVGCLPGAEMDETIASVSDVVPQWNSRAHLKVQDGCNCRCAFCIVPQFRGAPFSMSFAKVRDRALRFLEAGFREIVLTGCNLCLYRSEGRDLSDLASCLASLDSSGAHRIRFGSIEPGICDKRLVDAMAEHGNICRFIHISLQSASDNVLKLMRRPYTADAVREFQSLIVSRLGKRVALGADVIAGFPGESENDFRETCAFLGDEEYSDMLVNLHVFPYSERPGTAAAAMRPVVPKDVRISRAKELEKIGIANRNRFAQKLIGEEVEVCVEKDGNGRTGEYMRCLLKGVAPRRSLVKAHVEDYSSITGELSATIRT